MEHRLPLTKWLQVEQKEPLWRPDPPWSRNCEAAAENQGLGDFRNLSDFDFGRKHRLRGRSGSWEENPSRQEGGEHLDLEETFGWRICSWTWVGAVVERC